MNKPILQNIYVTFPGNRIPRKKDMPTSLLQYVCWKIQTNCRPTVLNVLITFHCKNSRYIRFNIYMNPFLTSCVKSYATFALIVTKQVLK